MPMQPKPMADISGPFRPSMRVFIMFLRAEFENQFAYGVKKSKLPLQKQAHLAQRIFVAHIEGPLAATLGLD